MSRAILSLNACDRQLFLGVRVGSWGLGVGNWLVEFLNKDTTPYIHRPGDTMETINFDYLGSTTRLIVEVMRMLTR